MTDQPEITPVGTTPADTPSYIRLERINDDCATVLIHTSSKDFLHRVPLDILQDAVNEYIENRGISTPQQRFNKAHSMASTIADPVTNAKLYSYLFTLALQEIAKYER